MSPNLIGRTNTMYVQSGDTIPKPELDLEGHTLEGWYTPYYNDNGAVVRDKWDFESDILENDITLYAEWRINQYTINFSSKGGSFVPAITQDYYSSIIVADPERKGYTFLGWDPVLPSVMPAENLTLSAQWEINQYNITYFVIPEMITNISIGTNSSIVTSNGRIFTWGYNLDGRVGDGGITTDSSTPREINSGFNLAEGEIILDFSLGSMHSAAITSFGRIFLWGNNSYGQIGDGTQTNRFSPVDITSRFNLSEDEKIIQVDLGSRFSSAVTSMGRIFTWGNNLVGQLGDGTLIDSYTPIDITSRFSLSEGEVITEVSLGAYYAAALTSFGNIFTWGSNSYGVLGYENSRTPFYSTNPTRITNKFGLSSEEKIIQVSTGDRHSSILTSSGRIFTWGCNYEGQLGKGYKDDNSHVIPIDISSEFNLYEEEIITYVSMGYSSSSAITSFGRIFTWGFNIEGKLGDGTTTDKYSPTDITSQFDLGDHESFSQVSLEYMTTTVLTTDNRIFTFGVNYGITPRLFSFDDLHATTEQETYDYNSQIIKYIPIREGYIFDDWYIDEDFATPYIFTTMPDEDISLYARWIKND